MENNIADKVEHVRKAVLRYMCCNNYTTDDVVILLSHLMFLSDEDQLDFDAMLAEARKYYESEKRCEARSCAKDYHVFYHGADLDGHCSGAIAKYFLEDFPVEEKYRVPKGRNRSYYPINYGDDAVDFSQFGANDVVILLDFVFQPLERCVELAKKVHKLIVIDHHVSSVELSDMLRDCNFQVIVDTSVAACELSWTFFRDWCAPTQVSVPLAVTLLGRYDTFRKSEGDWNGETLPFQYGMRLQETDPRDGYAFVEWMHLFEDRFDEVKEIIANGETILMYEQQQNERKMKNAFEAKCFGLRFLCCFGVSGSMAFESRFDPEKHDAMMTINNVRNEYWTISMYTDNKDFNLSLIATRQGGGGHRGAAGFQVPIGDTWPLGDLLRD